MSVGDLIFQLNAVLHDFQFYQRKPKVYDARLRSVKWKNLPIGWLKINIDGAFSSSEQLGRIGVIIRVMGKATTATHVQKIF